MPRRKKREPNSGSFQPGHDPRRHVFTRQERQKGYRNAVRSCSGRPGKESWDLSAWLFRRVRSFYRAQKREGGEG